MEPQGERIRAFVAMRVSEEVEAALAEFIQKLSSPRDGIAWSRPDKLHITLRFLGAAVDPALLAPLKEALARIAGQTPPLLVRTCGVGGFPDLRHPRVLWAGLECDRLGELAAKIEDAAVAAGFEPSRRPWAPHLTIGRVRNPHRIRRAVRLLKEAHDRDFGVSRIAEVALYRSRLAPEGAEYERLAAFGFSSPV